MNSASRLPQDSNCIHPVGSIFWRILTDTDFPQGTLMLKLWQKDYDVQRTSCSLAVEVVCASAKVTDKICARSN